VEHMPFCKRGKRRKEERGRFGRNGEKKQVSIRTRGDDGGKKRDFIPSGEKPKKSVKVGLLGGGWKKVPQGGRSTPCFNKNEEPLQLRREKKECGKTRPSLEKSSFIFELEVRRRREKESKSRFSVAR